MKNSKKVLYQVCCVQKSHFSVETDMEVKNFYSEVDAYDFIIDSIKPILENESEITDFSGDYNLDDEIEQSMFLSDMREMSEVQLSYLSGSTSIKLTTTTIEKEDKIEFYMVTEDFRNDEFVEYNTNIHHFRTEKEAKDKFKELTDSWKNSKKDEIFNIVNNGILTDCGYEYRNDEYESGDDYFRIVNINDHCVEKIEISYERVVL